jgi:hypothetical protein
MAEDLGDITIRFAGGITGGGIGGDSSANQFMTKVAPRIAGEATKGAVSQILSSLPQFASVVRAGTSGSLGAVSQAGGSAIAAAGGGVAAAALGGVAVGLGAVVVAAIGIKLAVGRILDRVSELASVSGAMAQQQALNTLQDMKQSMREASVLGPLYEKVASLWRTIKDLLQPFILLFKVLLVTFIVPALNLVIHILKKATALLEIILKVLEPMLRDIGKALADFGVLLAGAAQAMGATMSLTVGSIGDGLTGLGEAMEDAADAVHQILDVLKNQGQQNNPNLWAINTLTDLRGPYPSSFGPPPIGVKPSNPFFYGRPNKPGLNFGKRSSRPHNFPTP